MSILKVLFIHIISYKHPTHIIKHQEHHEPTIVSINNPPPKLSTINNKTKSDMPSTRVWYCCSCGFGPCNESIDYFCPNCQARRCHNCTASKISNRYNYGLTGEAESNPYPKAFTPAGFNTKACNINPPSQPFSLPQQHLERAPLALMPTQSPPTCLATGHQHSANGPSIGDIFQHGGLSKKSPSSYYYCCQCHDGPKLYDLQPVCINCDHRICRSCKPA